MYNKIKPCENTLKTEKKNTDSTHKISLFKNEMKLYICISAELEEKKR